MDSWIDGSMDFWNGASIYPIIQKSMTPVQTIKELLQRIKKRPTETEKMLSMKYSELS
jgi:hypothetical protein